MGGCVVYQAVEQLHIFFKGWNVLEMPVISREEGTEGSGAGGSTTALMCGPFMHAHGPVPLSTDHTPKSALPPVSIKFYRSTARTLLGSLLGSVSTLKGRGAWP